MILELIGSTPPSGRSHFAPKSGARKNERPLVLSLPSKTVVAASAVVVVL